MTDTCGCSATTDARKLVRQGTDQVQRIAARPDPSRVPIDERRPEHAMVFARAYADYLNYYGTEGHTDGTWEKFFSKDVSAQLAVAAVEDVARYRSAVKEWLRSVEDPVPPASGPKMVKALGAVFDAIGTLTQGLDDLKEELPADHELRATLGNLIRSQLSPMLRRLIGYYLAGQDDPAVTGPTGAAPGDMSILGRPVASFEMLLTGPGLSADWVAGTGTDDWADYVGVDPTPHKSAFGTVDTMVAKANHLAAHNQFTAVCETFLGGYARVVDEARASIQASFEWDGHQPHYALFLAFLRLLEHARAEINTLSAAHLDFYYRDVLRLRERPAQPGQAHVLVELARHVSKHLIAEGALLKAGKDDTGADAHFAVDRDLTANKAAVAELRSAYRHHDSADLPLDNGRLFASPVANSDDGLGADLSTPDQSWHPFANKVYQDGSLQEVRMPPAEAGFAIASHYLWMAEGSRTVQVDVEKVGAAPSKTPTVSEDVHLVCRLTTENGWIEKHVDTAEITSTGLRFALQVSGDDPPISPYHAATHGYAFDTAMPVLVVTLRHQADQQWGSAHLHDATVGRIWVRVAADGLRTFTASNDAGPLNISKPFQAYGPAPTTNSTLVIGSKEAFQKTPHTIRVKTSWMSQPSPHKVPLPKFRVDYLTAGTWKQFGNGQHSADNTSLLLQNLGLPEVDEPDLTEDAPYTTSSRAGFIRFRLTGGFGLETYTNDLVKAIVDEEDPPAAPVVPTMTSLTLDYEATHLIDLTKVASGTPRGSQGRFFHVTPFGHAEQFPPEPGEGSVTLLPRFRAGKEPAEAALYIGVRHLAPPKNLALLFQVADGTANPLVVKPEDHIRWSYLRHNRWVPFPAEAVDDGTDGLLASGIVTLAVPSDASTEHTALPPGMHWIRLAVTSASDAVCRLVAVAAQALQATYQVHDNGSVSHTYQLPPHTITKLDTPHAAVKEIEQRYPTFGGRPVETPDQFATRVAERLRHKDRAITQWDYEHLVLEAFPGIYQARCLNHTRYEPCPGGTGIYRELAPGHVTVVTIPDLAVPNPRDALRPYTSLRVLGEIERFLAGRMSCFAKLHVRNPQFEVVRTDLRVRFRHGFDETFHVNRLKGEITEFLSPWAFRDDARPSFNGRIHKSVLVDFIEERPYVDYITDVRLFRRDPDTGEDGPDREEAVGSRAISILVSVPPHQHGVEVIRPDEVVAAERCACGPETGG